MKPIRDDDRQDIDRILAKHGYSIEDFEVSAESDRPPVQAPAPNVVNRTITVHRKRSDTIGQFRGESGQPTWLIAFEDHLASGFFGKP